MNPAKPSPLRVIVFIDGQNFYHDCLRQFGHGETYPHLLGRELCSSQFGLDRQLQQVRFYTGIHSPDRHPHRHASLTRRVEMMHATEVWTLTRPLRYSMQWIKNPDQPPRFIKVMKGREKGIDVSIALDLILLAIRGVYDVAVLVSSDSDLDVAVEQVLSLRESLNRWLAVENAVCVPPIDPITGKHPPFSHLASARRLLNIERDLFQRIRDDTQYHLKPLDVDE